MSTIVSYKDNTLTTIEFDDSATLTTKGTWLEDDITINVSALNLQTKTVTPSGSTQNITKDSSYDALGQVTVNPIPSNYIIPTGTIQISGNGTYDVSAYATAEASFASTINNQNKSVTPTESQQTISADSGYTGLGTVTVGAISNTYVGSGITRQNSLSVNGRTVTANAGYYANNTTATIPFATIGAGNVEITSIPISVNSSTGLVTANYSNHDGDFSIRASSGGYVNSGNVANIAVDVGGSYQLSTQAATTITPTTSA